MTEANTNNKVAKELSDAMARCKQQGIDEQTLRTGLLTITIANFVNRIGMANTLALFEALPEQISSGIFDRYIDPNTNTPSTYPRPAPAYQPSVASHPQPQQFQQQQPPQHVPLQQVHSFQQPGPPHGSFASAAPAAPGQQIQQTNPGLTQPALEPIPNPYQNTSLPQSFVPPYAGQVYGQPTSQSGGAETHGRRKLPD